LAQEARKLKVKEMMSCDFAAVLPTTSLKKACEMIAAHRLPGLPVVNRANEVIGFLAEKDIAKAVLNPIYEKTDMLTLDNFVKAAALSSRDKQPAVEDIMVKQPIAVTEDTDCSKAASLLVSRRLKVLPVIRDKKLVGILLRASFCSRLMDKKEDRVSRKSALA
jgi:CBS domain-containing protein